MIWGKSGQEAKFLFEISGTKAETAVVEFTAKERISSPFEVNVSLASEEEIEFDNVVGKEAVLTILGEEAERYLHGIVNWFKRAGSKGRFFLYQARVVPSLWLLSLERDCRIFQNKDVQEIAKQVFKDAGIPSDRFAFRLQSSPPVREYCVQYRETDLNFISRLLEEEGFFYFFEHAKDKHLLVFADSPVAYLPIPGEAGITYNVSGGMVPGEEYVNGLAVTRGVFSGKMTQRDFNFEKPALDLTAQEQEKIYQKLEVYDYPGGYLDQGRGKRLSQVRLQEMTTFQEKAEGQSVCPRFTSGFTFKLTDHERENFNREYLLVEVLHTGTQPQVLEERAETKGSQYANDFLAIPSAVNFRPERKTPRPVVEGIQTAMVVGPKGEEIYTDKYGRVKVQFHWDREGKRDEKSSCWIRVGSLFAGGQYGIIFTPRIGQEVIVDFLEGDPDQPIITGRVYNAENMPPYNLPNEKTKSAIKSNSSLGGDGFNEIRFEDNKGKEQIFIHAEKDVDFRVKNDRREWVGNDRHLIVTRDKLEKIERDLHAKIERDELIEIARDHNLKIGGKEAIEVGTSHSLKVGTDLLESVGAKHAEQVGQELHLKSGMKVVIEAGVQLTIKGPGGFVDIGPSGVTIQGTLVNINSGGSAGSGSGGSVVPPAPPLAAAVASNSVPGKDPGPPSHNPTEEEKEKKTWVEVELVDEEGSPVPGERYRVTLPDGKTVAEGTLDQNGLARVEGIDPGSCKITFPNLDKEAWEKA